MPRSQTQQSPPSRSLTPLPIRAQQAPAPNFSLRPPPTRSNQVPPKKPPIHTHPILAMSPNQIPSSPTPSAPTGPILVAPRPRPAPRPHPLSPARFSPPPWPVLAASRIGPNWVLGLPGSGAAPMPGPRAAQAQTLAAVDACWGGAGLAPVRPTYQARGGSGGALRCGFSGDSRGRREPKRGN